MPFQNRVLDKLFRGVLQDEEVKFAEDLVPIEFIDQAVTYLPLTLSQTQKDALYNAWRNEVSYIQGPPGTGKSYTILAMMISAVLLGKTVLFVSQKKVAIDIVRRELVNLLGENALIYVGSDSQERKQLQSQLDRQITEVSAHDFHSKLSRKEEALKALENEIQALLHDIARHAKILKDALESEQEYCQANTLYLKERDDFSQVYGEAYTKQLKLRDRVILKDQIDRYRSNTNKIQKHLASGNFKRKDLMFIRRFYKYCIKTLNADRRFFFDANFNNLSLYLERLLELNVSYANSIAIRSRHFPDLNQLRETIQKKEVTLREKKRLYVSRKFELQFLSRLKDHKTSVDNFRRLLQWTNSRRIVEAMHRVSYRNLVHILPIWSGEIKDLGQFLPFENELFDLVIVDESSQVNIAEIVPAFYRGRSFCVVGDEKQLGLNAAGLFALNRQYERLMWNRCFAGLNRIISYEAASEKDLIVSKSSILDLIINKNNRFYIPRVRLNEHFRSMPALAKFTSKAFYENDLLIMTEVGKNLHKSCFEAIKVKGQRDQERKIVLTEVEAAVEKLRSLIRYQSYLQGSLKQHGFTTKGKPSIGILSFVTDQRNFLEARIQEEFSEEERQEYKLFVGTPEEFQGNERNIMLITLGHDGIGNFAKAFFENQNRFNVATSRAINYTYFIYGGIHRNAKLLKEYIQHFGYSVETPQPEEEATESTIPDNRLNWRFDETRIESEFEFRVVETLQEFIRLFGSETLKLYNQVESCKKRIDFVILNTQNEECCAIEVDGIHHFSEDGYTYSEEHLERVAILTRAGWKIVHIPYHKWYNKGWLCDRADQNFQNTIKEMYQQIQIALGIESMQAA